MRNMKTMTAVALVAGLAAAPALADTHAAQNQNGQNGAMQNTAASGSGQQMSAEGGACMDQLERTDGQLAEMGYGRAGPGGYGAYGTAYRVPPPAAENEGTGALERPLQVSPRADMYALMRAGYVLARTGHVEACQQLASAAQELGDRYASTVGGEDFDRDGMVTWREEQIANAQPVNDLQEPLRAEQIIGGDLRNTQGEDLGDISDVVIGPEGQIRYVIVQTGGFLGFGEDEVPVPWEDLKVTAAPYRDTFVLDVDAQSFSEAPRIAADERTQLVRDDGDNAIENFWEDLFGEES